MIMRFGTSAVFFSVAPLLIALAAPSDPKGPAETEPRYETATNIDVMVVVTETKEVPAGSPLGGYHLLVRPESSKADAETTDVYLAPADFLKDFDCHFSKGDRVQVKGSKVKFNGSSVVLAREVRLNSTTVYLRDDRGAPYWKAGKS
jgi:hypothetical protein